MATDLQSRLAQALAPAYEVDGEIGRGGMAIVYRARDTRLKRGVAVKLLPPELAFRPDIRSRFLREAQMAARLGHPSIVPIYAVDERDDLVYFVMGLLQGGSVGDRLRREGALPVGDARRILRQVAEALAYAHAHGVVHRDIKPDNILFDAPGGRAVVTDFGIARAASDDEGGTRLTATGVAIGTPAYMSPEQCAGDREIDGRSDLYSLGTVAYQMLAGQPPFTGSNTPSVMMKHVTEPPVPLRQRRPDMPEDLERIVMRLLAKSPDDRFADGAALVAALDGAPVTPLPPPSPSRTAARDSATLTPGQRAVAPAVTNLEMAGENLMRAAAVIDNAHRARKMTREQRRALKDEVRRLKHGENLTIPERMRKLRHRFASFLGTSVFLAAINYVTGPGFWWCLFPILAMALGLVSEAGRLWADGVPVGSLFGGPLPPHLAAADPSAAPALPPASATPNGFGTQAPAANDPYAGVLRQAMADRSAVNDLLARLSESERAMLPDVRGTADALMTRIVSLHAALGRLDPQVRPDRLPALDDRIAQLEREPAGSADRERILVLLRRQREKLAELVQARARLLDQYESAALLLQNLSLDLLKVRTSGLDSAMSGLTSVTQEARALSREIGYVLSAAEELKNLEPT